MATKDDLFIQDKTFAEIAQSIKDTFIQLNFYLDLADTKDMEVHVNLTNKDTKQEGGVLEHLETVELTPEILVKVRY